MSPRDFWNLPREQRAAMTDAQYAAFRRAAALFALDKRVREDPGFLSLSRARPATPPGHPRSAA